MPSVVTKTVKSSGGDYSSASAAEAGENNNLVSSDTQVDIVLYPMHDTSQLIVTGGTTDATRFIRFTTHATARHAGVWDTSKYYLELATSGTTGGVIVCRQTGMQLVGMQVRNTMVSPTQYNDCIYNDIGTVLVDSCICRDGYFGIDLFANGSEARNSIAYGCQYGSAISGTSGGFSSMFNCTTIGVICGNVSTASINYPVAKNCYAYGGTKAWAGNTSGAAPLLSATNCMGNDTSVNDNSNGGGKTNCTSNVAYSTANFVNVTAGSEDLHITSGSALKDAGTSLSGQFTNDIDGDTRSGTWDVGADEYQAASGGVTVNADVLAAIFSLQSPTVTGGAAIPAVDVLAGVATLQSPTVTGSATIPAADVMAGVAALQAPTVTGDATIPAADVLGGVLSLQGPTVAGSASVASDVLAGVFSLQGVIVNTSGDVTIAADLLAGVATLQAPTVTGDAGIAAGILSAMFALQSVTVAGNATVTPGVLAGAFGLQAVTVTTGGVVAGEIRLLIVKVEPDRYIGIAVG